MGGKEGAGVEGRVRERLSPLGRIRFLWDSKFSGLEGLWKLFELGSPFRGRKFLLLRLWSGFLVAGLVFVGTGAAQAEFPDWNRFTDVQVIDVLTSDEDGKLRETPVWFVLLNSEPFLRTNDSRWLANIRRDPNLQIRIEGTVYEARAEEIPGREILEKVDIASRRKYGLQERLIHLFRIGSPQVLRLFPREGT
jgi:hypothetical protein